MKNEKDYETFFLMSRNLFFLPRAFGPRRKTSHSEQRIKLIAAFREANQSGMETSLAFCFLTTPITG